MVVDVYKFSLGNVGGQRRLEITSPDLKTIYGQICSALTL